MSGARGAVAAVVALQAAWDSEMFPRPDIIVCKCEQKVEKRVRSSAA